MGSEDQIPPALPLQKGGVSHLCKRGGGRDFQNNMPSQLGLLSNS